MRACPSGSSAVVLMRTPMRRTRSVVGCARAASGHAAAALQSVTMNSRRPMWIAMRPSRGELAGGVEFGKAEPVSNLLSLSFIPRAATQMQLGRRGSQWCSFGHINRVNDFDAHDGWFTVSAPHQARITPECNRARLCLLAYRDLTISVTCADQPRRARQP
jgi:hypothetical protein